jgi:aminopeptidase N
VHKLAIAYHGKIGTTTLGFFAMDYTSPQGPRRTLATNFEPASARTLLPCWDEPARKATFSITVDAPKDSMAVSNMPVASKTPLSATLQRVHFATSPKMSTYLLFLGIGDFERIHRMVDGVDVGVVVKRGDTAKAAYALDQASALLHYYDGYFGVRFPLPKLDLVAAPGEIHGGSMENWGAIFYSQDHLLFDPAKSTERDRQLVFLVVSHEMAHQWFGDLVTMAWWDNLWLNEGFARWMQTYAADALHPEWKTGLQAQDIFEDGKTVDALPSTHPVLQPVESAEQAEEAFDGITYDKGAAVITMLNAYIGPDAFREGVQRYMHAHAFANAVDTDLWSIMQTVAGKPILQIERDFTRQEGLPLVRVSETPQGIHLAVGRFFADPDASAPAQHWTLPLATATPGAPAETILLQDQADIPVHPPVLVNAGQTGYARVLYPQPAFAALLSYLPRDASVDQLGLLNDALALGYAEDAPPGNVLAIMKGLPADADPIVWSRVVAIIDELDHRYADKPGRAAFRAFARNLLAPVAARWIEDGKPDADANAPILRSRITIELGDLGDAQIIATARSMINSDGGNPAAQRAALTIAAAQADEATFDSLLARARQAIDPLEKLHIYRALGEVENPDLARRLIAIALSGEMPPGSNVSVLISLARNHPDLGWNEIVPHLGDPKAGFDRTLQWRGAGAIAEMSSDPKRIADLQDYLDKNVPADARKPFAGSIATIRDNGRIAAHVLPQLDAWIAALTKR